LLTKIYSPVLSGPKGVSPPENTDPDVLTWDEELDYDTIGDLKRRFGDLLENY